MHDAADRQKRRSWSRATLRVLLALFFLAAGAAHFRRPDLYVRIVPPYLPWPLLLVYLSGACEAAGGVGVLIPRLRRAAGWGLIALLIAVFPANVYMAVGDVRIEGLDVPPLLLWLRLPLQAVLVFWVYRCTLAGSPSHRSSHGR